MKKDNLLLNIFLFTCSVFAPLVFILNLLFGIFIDTSSLLSFGGVFVILVIALLVSAFILILRDKAPAFLSKRKIFVTACSFYTVISVITNLFVVLVALSLNSDVKGLWNVYSVALIFAFSVIISIFIFYFKPKSYAVCVTVYFFVIGIFYYLLTVTVGGLATGNTLLIIIFAYVFVYAIIATVYSLIRYRKKNKELSEKPYEKQF